MVTQVAGSYADLCTWENLYAAYRKAAKGKRGRSAAARFEYRLEDNLIQLQDELLTETYRPGPYANRNNNNPANRNNNVGFRVMSHGVQLACNWQAGPAFCAGQGLCSEDEQPVQSIPVRA